MLLLRCRDSDFHFAVGDVLYFVLFVLFLVSIYLHVCFSPFASYGNGVCMPEKIHGDDDDDDSCNCAVRGAALAYCDDAVVDDVNGDG